MESVPLPGSPNAHLTLLPPRPLLVHIDEALDQARSILRGLSAFPVELSGICRFPETNVLYVEIGRGNEQVRRAHDALNVAKLAYQEEFEFIPHVTLTQPVSQDKVEPLQQRIRTHWSSLDGARSFVVDHAVFLWHSPEGRNVEPRSNKDAWQRLWSEPLPRAVGA